MTSDFDRWDELGYGFVFGYDARKNLVAQAESYPDGVHRDMVLRAERAIETERRARPENVQDRCCVACPVSEPWRSRCVNDVSEVGAVVLAWGWLVRWAKDT